jgi:glutathione S-transferase
MLKLFGHDTSPYVRRTRILLDELDIPFERDSHGWLDATDEFKAASPVQRLPMLDRGPAAKTRYVYDSKVIAEVLYRDLPSLRAPGKSARPDIQQTLFRPELEERDVNVFTVIDGGLDAAINGFALEQSGLSRTQSSYLQRQFDRAHACFTWLEGVYASGPTLTPDQLAYVDLALVCALSWFKFRMVFDLAAWPRLAELQKLHERRPSFVATNVYTTP